MALKIIGITGSAGVGKDTFAEHLCQHYLFARIALADPIKRICKDVYEFTDKQLWGPSHFRNEPDGRYPLRKGEWLSPRVALQICGTEFGRFCYPNTWIDKVIRDAKAVMSVEPTPGYDGRSLRSEKGYIQVSYAQRLYEKERGVVWGENIVLPLEAPPPGPAYAGVVVPDVRFANEMDAIHNAGGLNIRLKRDLGRDPTTVGVQGHASEAEQLRIPDEFFDFVINAENGLHAFYTQIEAVIPFILTRLNQETK